MEKKTMSLLELVSNFYKSPNKFINTHFYFDIDCFIRIKNI